MKYEGVCIAVKDVKLSKKFYQELFELKVFQDYGINVSFGGVKEAGWGQRSIRFYDLDGHIIEVGENMKIVVKRFLDSGLSMLETSERMDVPVTDLETILNS